MIKFLLLPLVMTFTAQALDPVAPQREKQIREFFLSAKRIIFENAQGRIDLSDKDSRYIFSPSPDDPLAPTYVIPLATVRQPITNPDVLVFSLKHRDPEHISLQNFLLDRIFKPRAVNGLLDLYRGADASDERATWQSGRAFRAARYWTPDINYAWRYARRQPDFLTALVKGEAPLFLFRISLEDFESAVNKGDLTLGAELPMRTHSRLETGLGFTDHLANGQQYLGIGDLGVEVELRTRNRHVMATKFVKSVSPTELIEGRRQQIASGYARAVQQWPQRKDRLISERDARLQDLALEAKWFSYLSCVGKPCGNGQQRPACPARAELSCHDAMSLEECDRALKKESDL
jgi:hypothetical protein